MDKKSQLHNLRVKFIEMNIELTKGIRAGANAADLSDLNQRIESTMAEIKILEESLKIK